MATMKSIWILGVILIVRASCLSLHRGAVDEEYQEMLEALRQQQFMNGNGGRPRVHASEAEQSFGGPGIQEMEDGEPGPHHGGETYMRNSGGEEEGEEDEDFKTGKLELDEEWPAEELQIGQVGGLAVDHTGQVHVFHRVNRVWEDGDFDLDNEFTRKEDGPIEEATLLMLNKSDGKVLKKWGEKFFYLPHGLTIDPEGNFWMTDVARHQVFKFKEGAHEPSLTLGKEFEPAQSNDDTERFCKPTDVAVASNGDFFVSDGYCNSRVMKFDKDGKFIDSFGEDEFWVPHSLALAEDLDLVCVADRENQRIPCYNAGLKDPNQFGQADKEYTESVLGRVFAVDYSPTDGFLYVVNGPTRSDLVQGFTIDLREDESFDRDIIAVWSPDERGFDQPHDVAVAPDGKNVYVGEIGPNYVWKFQKDHSF